MRDTQREEWITIMVFEGLEPGVTQILRPRRKLVARSIAAALALLVPLFVVLYWLTVPRGTWLPVAGVQLVVTVLGVLGIIGARGMHVKISALHLDRRNLFGHVTTWSRADIASVVLVDVYQSATVDTLTHLYLLDVNGDVLLHLGGQVWPRSGLERLVDTLGVTVLRPSDPVTVTDLRRLRPRLRPRFLHRYPRRKARPDS